MSKEPLSSRRRVNTREETSQRYDAVLSRLEFMRGAPETRRPDVPPPPPPPPLPRQNKGYRSRFRENFPDIDRSPVPQRYSAASPSTILAEQASSQWRQHYQPKRYRNRAFLYEQTPEQPHHQQQPWSTPSPSYYKPINESSKRVEFKFNVNAAEFVPTVKLTGNVSMDQVFSTPSPSQPNSIDPHWRYGTRSFMDQLTAQLHFPPPYLPVPYMTQYIYYPADAPPPMVPLPYGMLMPTHIGEPSRSEPFPSSAIKKPMTTRKKHLSF
ncbi:hypothetical protein BC940DRAFT_54140 [Gongronella butleri]|nr:hypothetical protein BC940DRAFT_54140 [Gongronella butleri]